MSVFILWLVTLCGVGMTQGWDTISIQEWLLLVPFFLQDQFDTDLHRGLKK